MRRFWREVTVEPAVGGHRLLLDGRPVRTPARAELRVPGAGLAEAIAAEWRDAPAAVRPQDMPLTGLANAAIDRIAPDPPAFAGRLAAYAACDTLCYRAEAPELLVARQATLWEPVLSRVEAHLDARFRRTTGIDFAEQPEMALARVAAAYRALDPFRLAGLFPIVSITASGILGLAVLLGLASSEEAWKAGLLEELWQAEQWGEDSEAAASRALRRREFDAGARLLALLP